MRCQICDSITENFKKNPVTGEYECICDNCKKKMYQYRRRYFDITQEDLKQFIDKETMNDNGNFDEGA